MEGRGEAEDGPASGRFVVIGGDLGYLVRFRSDLIRGLVAHGHAVTVLTPDSDRAPIQALADLGVDHHQITLSRTGTNPIEDARSAAELYRWMRRQKPTAVFAYGAKPITVGLSAAWLAGVRRRYAMLAGLGYAFIEGEEPSVRRWIVRTSQKLVYRLLFARSRAVIFHNEEDRRLLVSLRVVSRGKTWVVPGSGVDLREFPPSPAPVEPVRFLFIGRLLRFKGVMELLEAARLLRTECPEAEVHIAGGRDVNPESIDESVLRASEAAGDVVLHGHVADVRPLLAGSSVFVLPSYREGLPRSGLEALATGRTVIMTDAAGCREIVGAGAYGELVPIRDPLALAAAMIRYARDPERIVREGRAARKAAEERFDVRIVTARMLEALEVTRG